MLSTNFNSSTTPTFPKAPKRSDSLTFSSVLNCTDFSIISDTDFPAILKDDKFVLTLLVDYGDFVCSTFLNIFNSNPNN